MSDYIGPTQPITQGGAQENFQRMIDHILLVLPDAPVPLIKRRINHHLRNLQEIRMWAGLMVRGEFYIPAAYTRGTYSVHTGKDTVQGNGTYWPHNDAVNTTLAQAIEYANELQDIYPAKMTGINPGDYVLIGKEFILVHGIQTDCFQAIPTATHATGAAITRSSLTGRQFRAGAGKWMYTVRGVTDKQLLKLDHTWSYPSISKEPYHIAQAYVTFPPGLKMVWSIVSPAHGGAIKTHLSQEILNARDAGRGSLGNPYMLFDLTPDEIGRIRYEIYPTPVSEQGIPYIAARIIPDLYEDYDAPPPCIPSGVIVDSVIADLMITNRTSKYYDPVAAKEYRRQATEMLGVAIQQDDNIYMQNLRWDHSRHVNHGYAQSHDNDCPW